MTSSLIRGRPRRATSHISVRVAHTVLGGVVALVWLVLPGMTINSRDPVPPARSGPVAGSAAAPHEDESDITSLVLPLAAVALAAVLGGYGYLRRTRRARTRTTPGGGAVSEAPPVASPADLERQARAALVTADDSVRTSRTELACAQDRSGPADVDRFVTALHAAEAELAAAFAIRYRYEQGVPEDTVARRQALVGVVGRCAEAGRRLDAEAAAFDRARALDSHLGEALEAAERRFRGLTGRTAAAQLTLAELHAGHAESATASVTGYVEAAKDRLVFATTRLNRARQSADSGGSGLAARHLRAAEGAVAQADVLVSGIERLAARLDEAARLVPATLTGAESELAAVRQRRAQETAAGETPGAEPAVPVPGGACGPTSAEPPVGAPDVRLAHADAVLAAVREERTGGPYDPLDALRRIVRALERLGAGGAGVLSAAGALVAHHAVASADAFVATHLGAVGAEARTRLTEARRQLTRGAAGHTVADELAVGARRLAEVDAGERAAAYTERGEPADRAAAEAVLAGILLGEEPDAGPPASFGGPGTRDRRRLPPS